MWPATHCSAHCKTQQHIAKHRSTQQDGTPHFSHAVPLCNALNYSTTHCYASQRITRHRKTLQDTARYHNTSQHTTTLCNPNYYTQLTPSATLGGALEKRCFQSSQTSLRGRVSPPSPPSLPSPTLSPSLSLLPPSLSLSLLLSRSLSVCRTHYLSYVLPSLSPRHSGALFQSPLPCFWLSLPSFLPLNQILLCPPPLPRFLFILFICYILNVHRKKNCSDAPTQVT